MNSRASHNSRLSAKVAVLLLLLVLSAPAAANAADLLIAQAANFTAAMEEIIPLFKQATGLTAEATYTSSGKLYGQIENGAPFDVFLSADETRPQKLFDEGKAEKPFVYAMGQVVFWSLNKEMCAMPWSQAALSPTAKRVSIANTETAPYGASAMKAMQETKIWEEIQPRLVFGQNISQAFQFASTGAADAGFVAFSSTVTAEGQKGCYTLMPEAPKIVQAACVLKSAPHAENAARFVEFLGSPAVQDIKKKYGYE